MNERIDKLLTFLKADPQDSFVKHALALEYIKLDKEQEALQLFYEILTHQPGYVGSYYHLGKLLERMGKLEQAKEWYVKGMAEAKKADDRHTYNELQSAWEDLEY